MTTGEADPGILIVRSGDRAGIGLGAAYTANPAGHAIHRARNRAASLCEKTTMQASLKRALSITLRGICYVALALLTVGLILSLFGHLSACRDSGENIYPKYCSFAGVGAFVIFMYYVTLLPTILAISGGVLLVLDMVRFGRRATPKRSLPSASD